MNTPMLVPLVSAPIPGGIGQPEYHAHSPNANEELAVENGDKQAATGRAKHTVPVDPEDTVQLSGFHEASRRISAVPSASIARTHAIPALAPPPRDFEGRPARPTATPTSLDDLVKKDLPKEELR